jgi:hypothetical protein
MRLEVCGLWKYFIKLLQLNFSTFKLFNSAKNII